MDVFKVLVHNIACSGSVSCMGEVQLFTHAALSAVVGGPQKRGLSGGEKKRLSLGCELALQANIFLLDVSQEDGEYLYNVTDS